MPVDPTNLYAGYTRASQYSRVDKQTLQKALKPYQFDLKSSLGKSDSQLRKMAVRAVIDRYLARKKKITAPLTQGPRQSKSTDNF